jgi:hypothetical protein
MIIQLNRKYLCLWIFNIYIFFEIIALSTVTKDHYLINFGIRFVFFRNSLMIDMPYLPIS